MDIWPNEDERIRYMVMWAKHKQYGEKGIKSIKYQSWLKKLRGDK